MSQTKERQIFESQSAGGFVESNAALTFSDEPLLLEAAGVKCRHGSTLFRERLTYLSSSATPNPTLKTI